MRAADRSAAPGFALVVTLASLIAAGEASLRDRLAAAPPERGRQAFRVCSACHTVDAGAAHTIGPNPWGAVRFGGGLKGSLGSSGEGDMPVGRGADAGCGKGKRSFTPWTSDRREAGNDRCFSKRSGCDRPLLPRGGRCHGLAEQIPAKMRESGNRSSG